MQPDDALDHLQRLVEQTADPWLAAGYRRFLAGERLDEALGLSRVERLRLLRARRDAYLHEALALVTAEQVSPWRRCVLLEREVHRFNALFSTTWRTLEAPPSAHHRSAVPCFLPRSWPLCPTQQDSLPTSFVPETACRSDFTPTVRR